MGIPTIVCARFCAGEQNDARVLVKSVKKSGRCWDHNDALPQEQEQGCQARMALSVVPKTSFIAGFSTMPVCLSFVGASYQRSAFSL